MAEHISSQFNMELEDVRSRVLQMGGLVEEQISGTLAALGSGDDNALLNIRENDRLINELEVAIDEQCLVIIARRQPAASDLRLVLTVSRVIVDLERIGDEVKKIAKTAARLINRHAAVGEQFQNIRHMLTMAQAMLHRSLDAFARLDATAALELKERDRDLDREYKSQLRELITYMMEDARTITGSIDLLFMSKAVERIGDHAKNVGEHVVYLAKGVDIRHQPRETIERVTGE
ncbi:MAG: phosphate signaling complex protein PhoU [Neisseria sp.]|nr:phosphate signaling complex protein PhoU [Neisseria sp.]